MEQALQSLADGGPASGLKSFADLKELVGFGDYDRTISSYPKE